MDQQSESSYATGDYTLTDESTEATSVDNIVPVTVTDTVIAAKAEPVKPLDVVGRDRRGNIWYRLLEADSLNWLEQQRPMSIRNFVTGFPDFNEVKEALNYDWNAYLNWVERLLKLLFTRIHPDGYCILIQTDRKLGRRSNPKGVYELYSKAATVIEMAERSGTGTRLLWHKIAAFKEPGEASERPGYSHMLCFSVRGQHDLKSRFTDVVLSPSKLYPNATPLEAVELVFEFIKDNYSQQDKTRFRNTLNFDIVDPFLGQGTVGVIALKNDYTVFGLDIDPEQIHQASAHLRQQLLESDLYENELIRIVNDPITESKQRILSIDQRTLTNLKQRHQQGLANFLANQVQKEQLTFPFKRYHTETNELINAFKALKNLDWTTRLTILENNQATRNAMICHKERKFDPKIPVYSCNLGRDQRHFRIAPAAPKQYLVYHQGLNDYDNFDWISDYWTEDLRLACNVDEVKSPLEMWTNYHNLRNMLQYQLRKPGMVELKNNDLREAIYREKDWRECTQFKPGLFYCLIKLFNANSVLDTSAGWGDRLIGAMAANVQVYNGIDPEPRLHERYEKIYQTFQDYVCPSHEYFILPNQSEDPTLRLPKDQYDLIFSSPPFFRYESYSPGFDDTYGELNEQEWLDSFMYPTLQNTWKYLKVGGYYILYLCNTQGERPKVAFTATEKINEWIGANLPGAQYMGTIGTGRTGGRRYFSCWVWTRNQ